ncbi:MAG: glycosyltransferase [Candidatus Omnitrophota bacterium]
MPPRVSVIIPTYNCVSLVGKAIDSVLGQTFKDFEIIVIDDGSTDDTRSRVASYLAKEAEKIRYEYHKHTGASFSRNAGISLATGEYIALLDADDEFDEHMLCSCVEALERENADWCATDLVRIENGKSEVRLSNPPEGDLLTEILRKDFIVMPPFFRREALIEIGSYDVSLSARIDWDIRIRMFREHKSFVYINKPLYTYKIRKESIAKGNLPEFNRSTFVLLTKHHRHFAVSRGKEFAVIYAYHMKELGKRYLFDEKNIIRGLRCLTESMLFDFTPRRYFASARRWALKRLSS